MYCKANQSSEEDMYNNGEFCFANIKNTHLVANMKYSHLVADVHRNTLCSLSKQDHLDGFKIVYLSSIFINNLSQLNNVENQLVYFLVVL